MPLTLRPKAAWRFLSLGVAVGLPIDLVVQLVSGTRLRVSDALVGASLELVVMLATVACWTSRVRLDGESIIRWDGLRRVTSLSLRSITKVSVRRTPWDMWRRDVPHRVLTIEGDDRIDLPLRYWSNWRALLAALPDEVKVEGVP